MELLNLLDCHARIVKGPGKKTTLIIIVEDSIYIAWKQDLDRIVRWHKQEHINARIIQSSKWSMYESSKILS